MLQELRTLLPYLARYRGRYLIGSVAILAAVALKLIIPAFLGDSIDMLRDLGTSSGELDAGEIKRLITQSVLVIIGAALAGGLTRTLSRLLILGTSRRIAHDVRNVVFERLLVLSPSFFVRNPTGQIMSRAINDMQNVQGLMGPVIMYLAETSTLFVIGITMMVRIAPELALIGLAPFPFFLFAARKIAVRIQEGSRKAQNSLAEVSAKVDESLTGQLVIKTLALEDYDRNIFHDHCSEYRALTLEVARQRAIIVPMMMALTSLSTIVVLGIGGSQVARGEMSLGTLVTMLLYMQMLAGPTRTLGFIISSLRRGASAMGRIREIIDAEVTLVDPIDGVSMTGDHPVEIRVENLTVSYPPPLQTDAEDIGERTVLENVSLTIPPGHSLGIVGHVGSGKTTLVRAIGRQLEVEPGHIFIDGVDITRYKLSELRRATGMVPQDAFLFSASLAENVALGVPDADRATIERAVERAQLARDLGQLPDGLDTVVGERGVNLSGGQRQRTALARVLLMEPRILILDDTLSAVDTDTADAILAELRPFAGRRTSIIVSHRLSTLQHADEIIVFDEGRIGERGTHDTLMRLGGKYASIYAQQEQQDEQQAREATMRRELELDSGDDGGDTA